MDLGPGRGWPCWLEPVSGLALPLPAARSLLCLTWGWYLLLLPGYDALLLLLLLLQGQEDCKGARPPGRGLRAQLSLWPRGRVARGGRLLPGLQTRGREQRGLADHILLQAGWKAGPGLSAGRSAAGGREDLAGGGACRRLCEHQATRQRDMPSTRGARAWKERPPCMPYCTASGAQPPQARPTQPSTWQHVPLGPHAKCIRPNIIIQRLRSKNRQNKKEACTADPTSASCSRSPLAPPSNHRRQAVT